MPATTSSVATAESIRPRAFAWNGGLIAGLGMLALIALAAIFAPLFLADQASGLGSGPPNSPSTPEHLLGTDTLGRDMLARTLVATRPTVLMAVIATGLAAVAGIAVGVAIWLAPKRIREFGLRCVEFAVSYPTMLVAIIVAAILGQGIVQVVVAIAVANTAGFARLTANLAARISTSEYVTTARLMGVPTVRIATRHVLPNMAEPTLILIAGAFAGTLVEISGLSFLGLGAQSPAFDWGTLLNEGLSKIAVNPIVIVGPAVALTFTSLAALLVGDGLAAAANPRSNSTQARLVRSSEPASVEATPADAVLVAEGITVIHESSGRELVSNVSFTIRRGEVLGIVGESGSGKSLTASVVAKLLGEGLSASARRLELAGTDLLAKVPDRKLASSIGLVYQDPGTALNPALLLGNQLTDVLRRLGHSRRNATAKLLSGFRDVQLSDPAGRLRQYPHQLSGGMKQRAMIASAMSPDPDLLIADEPTTALDVTVQREVLTVLKRMNTESGTAILFISHDLGVVRALCDRVLVLKDGRIVEQIDDTAHLTDAKVKHPYTKRLLAATPVVSLPSRSVRKEVGV